MYCIHALLKTFYKINTLWLLVYQGKCLYNLITLTLKHRNMIWKLLKSRLYCACVTTSKYFNPTALYYTFALHVLY